MKHTAQSLVNRLTGPRVGATGSKASAYFSCLDDVVAVLRMLCKWRVRSSCFNKADQASVLQCCQRGTYSFRCRFPFWPCRAAGRLAQCVSQAGQFVGTGACLR